MICLDQSETSIHLEDEREDEKTDNEALIGGGQSVSCPELVHRGEEVSHVHGTLLIKVRKSGPNVYCVTFAIDLKSLILCRGWSTSTSSEVIDIFWNFISSVFV